MKRGILLSGCVLGLLGPSTTEAQVCRRMCRAGEVRDANRCCVSRAELRRRLRKRRGRTGSLRLEGDIRYARVHVGPRRFYVRLPTRLDLPPGRHTVIVQASQRVWRGGAVIKAGETTRLFASVTGHEWVPRYNGAARARAILNAALAAKGGAAKLRALRSVRYWGRSSADSKTFPGGQLTHIWTKTRTRWRVTMRYGHTRGSMFWATTPTRYWAASRAYGKTTLIRSAPPNQSQLDIKWQHPDRILLRHLEPKVQVALLPSARIDGWRMDVVQLARKDGTGRTRLYLDQRTRMLRRIERINDRGEFAPPDELLHYRKVANG